MQTKVSLVGTEARDRALKGVKYVARAVKSTLGPFGMNALIEKGNKITNDGFLISQELLGSIKDEFERRGATVGHEASLKTNDMVGDATSTAWALTDAIIDEAIRYLPNEKTLVSKKTPSEVLKMIEMAKTEVLTKLQELSIPIKDKDTLIKSALVSVENEQIAQILGETQWQLGPDGVIIPEEVNETTSSIEIVKGIRIDNGFSNSVVITNQEKQTLEISTASTILTNYTIGVEEIMKLKDSVFTPLLNQKQNQVAIIARAFTPDAIQMCLDSAKAGFLIYPINAPYTDQADVMRDLEAVLGGRYIDTEEGKLEDMYITDVGHCERLVAGRFDAIITGSDDEKATERIEKRIEVLKAKLKGSQSEFEKKAIEARIAQFTSGFAILKVGSNSLVDRKRLKDKCDDAVNAVRLALKGGTVAGAGMAFKEISDSLEEGNILKRPIRVIYDQIMSSAPDDFVIAEWVRDPYLVLKAALENACSVAGAFATTNIVIAVENPKKCKHDEEE